MIKLPVVLFHRATKQIAPRSTRWQRISTPFAHPDRSSRHQMYAVSAWGGPVLFQRGARNDDGLEQACRSPHEVIQGGIRTRHFAILEGPPEQKRHRNIRRRTQISLLTPPPSNGGILKGRRPPWATLKRRVTAISGSVFLYNLTARRRRDTAAAAAAATTVKFSPFREAEPKTSRPSSGTRRKP